MQSRVSLCLMQIKPSKKTLLMHSKQIRWASLGEWIPRLFDAATNAMVSLVLL